jgi:hypothetical protein
MHISGDRQFVLSIMLMQVCLLSACANSSLTHSDPAKNTVSNYKADSYECAKSYPETADGAYLKRRIACMNLKGWQ